MALALDAAREVDIRSTDVRRPEPLPQIPALTGLRFFAAFFILFAHAVDWLAQFQDSQVRTHFTVVAMYGMPLFFVLSGFVIHYNYGKLFASKPFARAVVEFGAARFARLFPLYFCFLLMAIVADDFVAKTFNRPALAAEILAYYLTLTQTWLYLVYSGQSIIYSLFSVSWSISTEMFFYLAYVPAVYLILRINGARRAFAIAAIYAAVVTLLFVWSRYELGAILDFAKAHSKSYIDIGTAFEHSFYRWFFYFSPYARVFEFLMGCLVAHLFVAVRERPISTRERRVGLVALVAALGLLVVEGVLYQGYIEIEVINLYTRHLQLNFLCAPAIAVVMFCACRYDNGFSRFMSLPILIALGDTSYSIYLVHTWTLRMFNHPITGYNWVWGIEAVFRVAFAIIFTLLVAYATYHLIEVPSRVWMRRKLSRVIAIGFGYTTESWPSGRARIIISVGAVSLLVLIVAAASKDAAWRHLQEFWYGKGLKISVVSATYGLNCKSFAVPAPYPNSASLGNVTEPLVSACNSLAQCKFKVDVLELGDPANACGKDFSVAYQSSGSDATKSAFLPPEANGKTVVIDCTNK